MKALIQNNIVVGLEANEFPVHESLSFMDAPEGCQIGWVLNDGVLSEPLPTKSQGEILSDFVMAIEYYVDSVANLKSYRSAVHCASYVDSTNQQWKDEALSFVSWRDSVWQYAYIEMDKYLNNERELTSIEDFLNELPAINWP